MLQEQLPMVQSGMALGTARMTVTDRLRARRDQLAKELQEVNDALDAMESNPEAAKLVDTLSKLGHF